MNTQNYSQNYKTKKTIEVFFNELFSDDRLMSLISSNFDKDFTDLQTQQAFFDVYENCSFLVTQYEYDRICLGSDMLDLQAATMLNSFM
jgi:hypothetical protein